MSDKRTKDKLIEQILSELGKLLKMRIDTYINGHYKGNKYKLLNEFIIFPLGDYSKHTGRDCYDVIANSVKKANHFDRHLSKPFELSILAIYLNDEGCFRYDFNCCDYELGADDNVDIDFPFTLIEDKIEMPKKYRNGLKFLSKQTLETILGKLKLDFYS